MVGAVNQVIEYRGAMRRPPKQALCFRSTELQVERERIGQRSQKLPGGLQRP